MRPRGRPGLVRRFADFSRTFQFANDVMVLEDSAADAVAGRVSRCVEYRGLLLHVAPNNREASSMSTSTYFDMTVTRTGKRSNNWGMVVAVQGFLALDKLLPLPLFRDGDVAGLPEAPGSGTARGRPAGNAIGRGPAVQVEVCFTRRNEPLFWGEVARDVGHWVHLRA